MINQQHALLLALRNPDVTDPQVIQRLRKHALNDQQQRFQIAALSGLKAVGGSEAVLVCAERLTDCWGMGAIARAISVLGYLAADGGLLVLTATLLRDQRFYTQKLTALANGVRRLGLPDVATAVERAAASSLPIERSLTELLHLPVMDLTAGVTLACNLHIMTYYPLLIDQRHPELGRLIAGDTPVNQARHFAEVRVPGLLRVLSSPERAGPLWPAA